MSGALSGIKVLDFGQYIAGPMAAMLLGDHGAEVIRIDPPGGPRYNPPANATWNRNKRSIVLDLKAPADLQTALALIDRADVLIENFRPGVMQRLGLGAAAMTARNPRLIYCAMPGFAPIDPRSHLRAWEGVLGAATACYAPDPVGKTGRPLYTAIPHSSSFGAFLSAMSIASALNARERDGRGQIVDVPLFNATFNAISNRCMKVWDGPRFRALPKGRHARCADDRWLMYAPGDKNFGAFLEAIGKGELKQQKLSPAAMEEALADTLRTRTAHEWEQQMLELGIEAMACYTSAEWLHHPQAEATGIVGDFDDPELGRFRGPAINVRLSETPGSVRRPRPRVDEHRAEILSELQHRDVPPPLVSAEDLRGALAGVKVLDLCLFIAGPTCGRTLGEFGADIIKIDSPHRNPVNWHADVNRGKRTFLLDLKQPEGMAIFWKLVDQADVVLQNMRLGAAEKIGIGYEQVKARKPDIVYCSINAYGQSGPYKNWPGVEVISQAMTGMQTRFGGDKPAIAPFNATDFATGLLSAYGVAAALLHRKRTGQGQHVTNALVYTASLLQSPFLQEYEGQQWDEPSGQQCVGTGPLYRAYPAKDAWVFLCTTREELKACEPLADLATLDDAALEKALEERLPTKAADDWVKRMNRAGIPAQRVVKEVPDLMLDQTVVAHGLSVTRFHQEHGPVTTIGPSAKLSRTPVALGRQSPLPGSDAASVLAEIGMEDELERLVKAGVVVMAGVNGGQSV